jgi:hypothetical protein
VALSAYVAEDLSGIVVAFDVETNLRGDLPCGDSLDLVLLGSDTKCLWGSDPVSGGSLLFLTCPTNSWYPFLRMLANILLSCTFFL